VPDLAAVGDALTLAAVMLPLAADTFALGAALGVAGLPGPERLRVSVILAGFEAGMPIIGFFAGTGIAHVAGRYAGYTGAIILAIAGIMLLRSGGDEEGEERRLALLVHARGIAIVDLGVGISVDELTIGFSLGLLHISLVAAVIWIALQGFAAAQLGLRLGTTLGEELREQTERAAGAALIAVAAVLLALRLA
jgi:manganese efflux pump family protein